MLPPHTGRHTLSHCRTTDVFPYCAAVSGWLLKGFASSFTLVHCARPRYSPACCSCTSRSESTSFASLVTSVIYSTPSLVTSAQADSPEVNDDLRAIKQVLAVFFMAGSDCTAICAALIPALRISIAAPPGSMDAEVDVDSMINFVIALSKPSTEGDGSGCQPNLHEHLAMVRFTAK